MTRVKQNDRAIGHYRIDRTRREIGHLESKNPHQHNTPRSMIIPQADLLSERVHGVRFLPEESGLVSSIAAVIGVFVSSG